MSALTHEAFDQRPFSSESLPAVVADVPNYYYLAGRIGIVRLVLTPNNQRLMELRMAGSKAEALLFNGL